jgi:hypothetical protein
MSQIQPQLVAMGVPAQGNAKRSDVGIYECLVVATDDQRQRMLFNAARDAGWNACLCANPQLADAQLQRTLFRLGVVDLQGLTPQRRSGFLDIAQRLSRMSQLLLVICGNESLIEEEIWARQQGAWLYLPGVTYGEDLEMVYSEARQLTDRLCPRPEKAEIRSGSLES